MIQNLSDHPVWKPFISRISNGVLALNIAATTDDRRKIEFALRALVIATKDALATFNNDIEGIALYRMQAQELEQEYLNAISN